MELDDEYFDIARQRINEAQLWKIETRLYIKMKMKDEFTINLFNTPVACLINENDVTLFISEDEAKDAQKQYGGKVVIKYIH